MEAASSSAAPATVCTLRVACSEAAATALDCWLVSSAVADIDSAVDCSSAVAEDSWPRTPETMLSKSRVSWSTLRARSSRSEEHTSELQSLMRTSYAVSCLNNKNLTSLTHISNAVYILKSKVCTQLHNQT